MSRVRQACDEAAAAGWRRTLRAVVLVAPAMLAAGSSGGTILGIDSVTGKLRWSRDVNQPINGSAAISVRRGVVYVPVAQPHRPRLLALPPRGGKGAWGKGL